MGLPFGKPLQLAESDKGFGGTAVRRFGCLRLCLATLKELTAVGGNAPCLIADLNVLTINAQRFKQPCLLPSACIFGF